MQKSKWISRVNAKKDQDTKEEKDTNIKSNAMLSDTL